MPYGLFDYVPDSEIHTMGQTVCPTDVGWCPSTQSWARRRPDNNCQFDCPPPAVSSGRGVGCAPCPRPPPPRPCPVPQKGSLEYAIKMTRENPDGARAVFYSWLAGLQQNPANSQVAQYLEQIAQHDIAAAIAAYWAERDAYAKFTRGNLTG